ncbi:hypothetical protein [Leptobacterium sp. I13]|uniref:hypothetical protein n=1 Tax=Leptobacterium meishanense TaxID=3128904 RepID=UPI0030ECFDE4
MKPKNKPSGHKIILIALLIAIAGLITLTYFNYKESNQKLTFLANEKQMIIDDLKAMQQSFGELAEVRGTYMQEINFSKQRIAVLLDSLNELNIDYSILTGYRKELSRLRDENQRYRRVIDSIQYQNLLLEREIDSSNLKIMKLSDYTDALKKTNTLLNSYSDSLVDINTNLSEKIADGSILNIYEFRGDAFKIKSSGKLVATDRAARAERIRGCFTILPNKLLDDMDKELYLQIIDPANNVLGAKKRIRFGKDVLTYSKKINVIIEDDPVAVCDYVTTKQGTARSGNYTFNLFLREKLIASTIFQLK